jgi:GT2 family glycosyltransferase
VAVASGVDDEQVRDASVSMITIARGRADHLVNQLVGLERQEQPPSELIVVQMGGPELAPVLGDCRLPTVLVALDVADDQALPLAAARNRGAAVAKSEGLIFLDVDCIPGASLVGSLAPRIASGGTVASAQVQYLPSGVPGRRWTETDLRDSGRFHPVRPSIDSDRELAPELLWSLAFAISSKDFASIDGFDEGYIGYGGEDTDFGLRAHAAGLHLVMVAEARAYHQFHVTHDPPLQHFDDLVMNASRFRRRWGRWPMEGWLAAMAELGLVDWTPGCTDLAVRRRPTAAEVGGASATITVPDE